MDPNACLRIINDATRINAEAREACENLYTWIARGGFAPDWTAYPLGTKRYDRWLKGANKPQLTKAHRAKFAREIKRLLANFDITPYEAARSALRTLCIEDEIAIQGDERDELVELWEKSGTENAGPWFEVKRESESE